MTTPRAIPWRTVKMWPFLVVTYALFAGQGAAAMITGIPSIDFFAGELYGNAWPVLLMVFSVGAIIGVVRDPQLRWLEWVCTVGIIALFMGYASVLLIWSALVEFDRLPIGIGMFAYCALSAYRLATLDLSPRKRHA